MIFYWDLIQQSEEWYKLRQGKVTGTGASLLLQNGRKDMFSVTAHKYAIEKASEIETGIYAGSDFTNKWMQNGIDNEATTRSEFVCETFHNIIECGFVDCGGYGFSPDFFVLSDSKGLLTEKGHILCSGEIKCRKPSVFHAIREGTQKVSSTESAQMNFQMYCLNIDHCYYVNYSPHYDVLIQTIQADKAKWEVWDERLPLFMKLIQSYVKN